MNVIFRSKLKKPIRARFFCGRCGKEVPFKPRFFTEYFQRKIIGVKKWIVDFSYVCPDCACVTHYSGTYSKSQSERMKDFGLYKQ
jgi:hypothetical protein